MIRVDVLALGLAAALAVAAGLASLREARRAASVPWARPGWSFVLTCLALACALVGLGLSAWLARIWPGATTGDGLALLAGGGLVCLLWLAWREYRGKSGAQGILPSPEERIAYAVALAAAGLVLLAAMWSAAWSAVPESIPQARNWLFLLRGLTTGLGLGGWLIIAASAWLEAGGALWRSWQDRRARAHAVPAEIRETVAAAGDAPPDSPAVAPVVSATSLATTNGGGSRTMRFVHDAFRFSYPWLTAALLAGSAWGMAAYAAPWRGRPAELWLAAAWLAGAAYLHLRPGDGEPGLHPVIPALLALLGLGASLLAAWQLPTLFSW